MITIFRHYRKIIAAGLAGLLLLIGSGSGLLFPMEEAAPNVQMPSCILEDMQTLQPHLQQIAPAHQQAFMAVVNELGALVNDMHVDRYAQKNIALIKNWSKQHMQGKARYALEDALDGMVVQHKIAFFCNKIAEQIIDMRKGVEELKKLKRDKERKQCEEALVNMQAGYQGVVDGMTELVNQKQLLDVWMMLKQRMIALRDAYAAVQRTPSAGEFAVDSAQLLLEFCEQYDVLLRQHAESVAVYARIKAVVAQLAKPGLVYTAQLYDDLNKSAGGSGLFAGFSFLPALQRQLLQLEAKLKQHVVALQLTPDECKEGVRLLSLFCAFYHKSEQAWRHAVDSEYNMRARAACAQLAILIKNGLGGDELVLKAAQDLKKFFEASIDGDQERLIRVIIASMSKEISDCEKTTISAIELFKAINDDSKQDAYHAIQARLYSFHRTVKLFKESYALVKPNPVLGGSKVSTVVYWLTEFYGHFNQCLVADCADARVNTQRITTTTASGLLWAMRATNLVTSYSREIQVLTYKKLYPVVSGENQEVAEGQLTHGIQDDAEMRQLKQLYTFLTTFGSDISQELVGSMGFGVRAEALMNLAKEQLGDFGRGTFVGSSLKKFNVVSEFSLGAEMKQRAFKMLASALYYHLGRSYFFKTGRPDGWVPTDYKPWREAGLEMLNVIKTFAKIKVGPIFDKIFNFGSTAEVSKWTLGVVSPALFDEGLSLAIDLSLTSAPVKSFLHTFISYDDADIYRGNWYGQVKAKHPTLRNTQMRALHVDQAIVSHLSRVVGAHVGRALGRLSATTVVSVVMGLFAKISGVQKLQDHSAQDIIVDLLEHMVVEDGSNLEGVMLHMHQMHGVTLLTPDDMRAIIEHFNTHKDRKKALQEIAEKMPKNAVGDVVSFLGSQLAPYVAQSYWTQHVTDTGRPVLVPSCFFDV